MGLIKRNLNRQEAEVSVKYRIENVWTGNEKLNAKEKKMQDTR